jgi:hypothetical protein
MELKHESIRFADRRAVIEHLETEKIRVLAHILPPISLKSSNRFWRAVLVGYSNDTGFTSLKCFSITLTASPVEDVTYPLIFRSKGGSPLLAMSKARFSDSSPKRPPFEYLPCIQGAGNVPDG